MQNGTCSIFVFTAPLEGIRNVSAAAEQRIRFGRADQISCVVMFPDVEKIVLAVIYLVFTLLEKFALCEMSTFTRRVDRKVKARDCIYLFEHKQDDTPEAALHRSTAKATRAPSLQADGTSIRSAGKPQKSEGAFRKSVKVFSKRRHTVFIRLCK